MSFKKAFLGLIFLCFFVFCISPVNAITKNEIKVKIAEIIAQIASLQQQLQRLPQSNGSPSCYNFNVNLKIGDAKKDVTALQNYLKSNGFSIGNDKLGKFSNGTQSAIVFFQQKYASEILTPVNLKYGNGFVGKLTRAKLNQLYGCAIVSTPVNIVSPTDNQINTNIDLQCQNLWWYDNATTTCQQKQFCGTYMYSGLQTFSTEENCKASLSGQKFFTIASPIGGEIWQIGNAYDIIWDSRGINKINIILQKIGASGESETLGIIASNLYADSGKYSWTISSELPSDGLLYGGNSTIGVSQKIVISDMESGMILSNSNFFAIVPSQTCDQKCQTRGYQSGFCQEFADFYTQNSYVKTHPLMGETSDCYMTNSLTDFSKSCYCDQSTIGTNTNFPPVFDGGRGPTQLKTNQVGIWTLKSHDPENGPLNYQVSWGDGNYNQKIVLASSQSETQYFTHSYSNAGTYTFKAIITDNYQNTIWSSMDLVVAIDELQNLTCAQKCNTQGYKNSVCNGGAIEALLSDPNAGCSPGWTSIGWGSNCTAANIQGAGKACCCSGVNSKGQLEDGAYLFLRTPIGKYITPIQ